MMIDQNKEFPSELCDMIRQAWPAGTVRAEWCRFWYDSESFSEMKTSNYSKDGVSLFHEFDMLADDYWEQEDRVRLAERPFMIWADSTRAAAARRGVLPNVVKVSISQGAAPLVQWIHDPDLVKNHLESIRREKGEEAYQDYVRERDESLGAAPQADADTGTAAPPPSTLSANDLLGHIVAEVGDSAPAGWTEWIMDGQVARSGQGAQVRMELTASYWVRMGQRSRLEPFMVRNVIGPLNALQDLQHQIMTPSGATWNTLRIRYVAGARSADVSFDPSSPPADAPSAVETLRRPVP